MGLALKDFGGFYALASAALILKGVCVSEFNTASTVHLAVMELSQC